MIDDADTTTDPEEQPQPSGRAPGHKPPDARGCPHPSHYAIFLGTYFARRITLQSLNNQNLGDSTSSSRGSLQPFSSLVPYCRYRSGNKP
ncbi:hypothetical protein P8C59_005415 [Phyllachora maydis]|uniref:Uncharacterized protein n=1 Tax=Phyllachora maydis TaxID=1825666 RepID=A0AAD9I4D2_9PEZI|nr:hypothetical protein P8C59_005415 [Phyllachora maydis]